MFMYLCKKDANSFERCWKIKSINVPESLFCALLKLSRVHMKCDAQL